MADSKIIQVVGYKNSGKTTFIEAWVRELAGRGLRAAVIKHHGHGGPLAMPQADADSMRVLAAGAVGSLACDDAGMIQLHMQSGRPGLPELLDIAKLAAPDVIIIEGYKAAGYPKIVLVRELEDWRELSKLPHIIGVIAHDGVVPEGVSSLPSSDMRGAFELLHTWMGGD